MIETGRVSKIAMDEARQMEQHMEVSLARILEAEQWGEIWRQCTSAVILAERRTALRHGDWLQP